MARSTGRRSAGLGLLIGLYACSGGGGAADGFDADGEPSAGDGTQTDTSSANADDDAAQSDGGPPASGGDEPGADEEAGTTTSGPSFPAVDDFAAAGPFETTSETTDASCTVYRPATLGEGGLRHPVILWGNGTGTPTVEVYAGFFTHWASHGFIVAAAHTATAGTGVEMLACLDWVLAQDALAGSPYEGHVDVEHVGASGHSQGGGGAIVVGTDPRVATTIPLQAWMGASTNVPGAEMQQAGPMFLVSGTADVIAAPDTNQKPIFEASNVPTFWATLDGGDHVSIALGNVAAYLAPTTAWFRLHLMGDDGARDMFYGQDCTLCSDASWMVQRKLID